VFGARVLRERWAALLSSATALVLLWQVVLLLARGTNPGSPPHFALLAQAFLHGRVSLDALVYDSVFFHGAVYLPFGPLPAVLLMPAVAIWGSDVPVNLLSATCMALTIPALWSIWASVGVSAYASRVWLTLLALGGTAYLSAMTINSTYFAAHAVSVLFLSWAVALALRRRYPALAGVFVGLATLTKAPMVLSLLPLALLYIDGADAPRRAALVALGALPAIALFGAYNIARFGTVFSTGEDQVVLTVPALISAHAVGLLSPQHLPKALYYFLAAAPLPLSGENTPVFKLTQFRPSDWGMGLVWVSPWLFAGVLARGRRAAILGLAVVLLVGPTLFYYGIGWVQFGYRYAIDALPFMAALAAVALAQRRRLHWLPAFAAYSLIVNVWGAQWLITRLTA
jgi:hypothetical protein